MEITDATRINLERAADEVADAKDALKAATADRDEIIRQAVRDGYSLRSIATVVGVNYQRIAQIADVPDDRLDFRATIEAYCPKCHAAPGEACEGRTRTSFHNDRHARRMAIHNGELDDVVEGEPGYTVAV